MISPILFSLTAAAFNITPSNTGQDVAWQSFPVSYTISMDGAPEQIDEASWRQAIAESFWAWEQVPDTKVAFEEVKLEHQSTTSNENLNTVWFETEWTDAPDAGAIATVWIDKNTIVGFDIRINADTIDWSDDGSATDVQATITHEIGHALGIDHSDIPDATMYFEILGNAVHQRSLDDDDEKAVSHLYSDRVLGVPTVLTCNSVSAAGATPWGLLALLTLIRRKRQTENSP